MHQSAHDLMAHCVETYMSKDQNYRVLDLGSRVPRGQHLRHTDLLRNHKCQVLGADVQAGRGVNVLMDRPYTIPLKSNSVDVVLSGQTFEHVPYFWVTALEVSRVLRTGGYFFITVPSRGHPHGSWDGWRFYPGGLGALATFSGLDLLEARCDFPPLAEGRRHNYAGIDPEKAYWGDTVGVMQKKQGPEKLPLWLLRRVATSYANSVGVPQRPGPRSDSASTERVAQLPGLINSTVLRFTGYELRRPGSTRRSTRNGAVRQTDA